MKNKILLMGIICLLLIPLATAYYSGDTIEIYQKDVCEVVNINITESTLPIIPSEYTLNPCTLLNDNYWECNCTDGIVITLTTTPSTINEYTFLINGWYYTTITTTPPPSSSGSGSSSSGGGSCAQQDYLKISTGKCVTGCINSESWYLRNGYKVGCGEEGIGETNQTISDRLDDIPIEETDESETLITIDSEDTKSGIIGWIVIIIIVGLVVTFILIKINKKRNLEYGGTNEKQNPETEQ